jgi:hypothetical protein
MTYITKHLPSLEELKKELEEHPERIKIYAKYEGFEGPDGTTDYIIEKLEEHYKKQKNESTKN